MAARGEAQADVEVSTLVVPAWRLRWRAPELALVLGERAVALASTRRDEIDRLRAESLVIFASNRMGRGVRIADRALDALRASDKAKEQETSWRLRIELAACATAVGAPLTGFGAVRPVLAADGVPHALRAAALVQASDCLVTIGRGPQLGMALSEADQLYVADTLLDADTRLLQRGLLHASAAAQHRRWGDLQAATDAAGKGLELLAGLGDPSVDSGQVRAKLTLELVCALMDSNRLGEASEVGSPLLDLPVRAPSAGDVGWLRLALATRVHLPAGRVDLARGLLRDAADSAQRHQLDTLLAESLLALAHVHEVSGDLAEALTDLRSAHAAERRRARAVYAVRARLAAEFSGAHRQPVSPHEQLGSLLRPGDGRPSSAQGVMRGSQPPADAVLAPELKQQLRQWRPTQVPKQEGVRVKRSLRAAEDMTVEGISAARAHAADRWRMVQPFGATAPDTTQDSAADPVAPSGGRRRAEDRESAATEVPATPAQGDETAVPATGLIAAAGAMRSGRRRAAREAAEDDTTPTQASPAEPSAPTAPWAAQEAAPEPAPEAVPDSASDTSPEVANVLDSLEAAGLLNKRRSGGRRRAPDSGNEAEPPRQPAESAAAPQPEPPSEPAQPQAAETPKWRVEPPPRLRSEDDQPKPPPSDLFDAPTTVHPAVGADGLPVERPSTGLGAAFAKGPAIPTARAPQTPSALEPPRPPESPRRPDANPAADHNTGTPHVGPDFRLDADSLGRSGFRPASNRPPAEQPFPAEGAADSPRPQAATPGHPDFRLSADSFGRDGFRTANPPADPTPTTPHDWPSAATGHDAPLTPDLPTASGTPDWAHDGGSGSAPGHSSTSRSPDWSATTASNRNGGSGADQPGWAPDTAQAASHPAEPGTRTGQHQDNGRDAEPNWAAGGTPGQATGHQPDSASHSTDWATTNDTTANEGRSTPGWATGGGPGSHAPDWTSGVPRPAETGPAHGGPRSTDPNGGPAQNHQQDPGLGQGFADAPDWATTADRAPTAPPETRPGQDDFGPDPRTQTDQGFVAGSRQAAGSSPDPESRHRSDQGFGADPRYSVDIDGFGDGFQSDHGTGRQGTSRSSDAGRESNAGHEFSAGHDSDTGHDFGAGRQTDAGREFAAGHESGAGREFAAGHDSGAGHDFGAGRQSDSGREFTAGRQSDQDAGTRSAAGSGSDQSARVESDSPTWAPGVRPTWDPSFTPTGVGDSGFTPTGTADSGYTPAGAGDSGFTPTGAGDSGFPSTGAGDPGFTPGDARDSGGYPGSGARTSGVGADFSDFSYGADFAHLSSAPDSLTVPQPPTAPTPEHEPDQVPAVPEPDQIPPIPDPDPIPQPAPIPMPPTSSGFDLGRSRFLTSADVEDDLPELPRRVPAETPPAEPDPFVTAVVVGDRTIEVPSAARASRRHKSDLSLAELLTEALVAYETGRRSDPEADQTASEEIADWISSAETPVSPISPDRLERAGHHVAEPHPEPAPEPEPRPRAQPTDSEKTTYLTPVRDVESTAPIWESGPDGEPDPPYDRWTLPES